MRFSNLSLVALFCSLFLPGAREAGAQSAIWISKPIPAAGDYFGESVAAVGSNVLVGAPYDDTDGYHVGAAYLFNGSTGALLQTFHNPNPVASGTSHQDAFGYSVAAVGSNVLVGTPGALPDWPAFDQTHHGAAYLFDSSTGALLQTFLDPMLGEQGDFGTSVAAVGSNVLVGAPGGDDNGVDNAGVAYLLDGSTAEFLQTFHSPSPHDSDQFGRSVAAVGGNVLVGVPFENQGEGAAYLFSGSTGALLRAFHDPTPAPGFNFGNSVAALGANVIVGARSQPGAVYLFDGSTGGLIQTFVDPLPDAFYDDFGFAVAAVGDNVLVGMPGLQIITGTQNSEYVGMAFLFDGSTGELMQTFLDPDPGSVGFGSSVAGVGDKVLVGAATYWAPEGEVFLFETVAPPAEGGLEEIVTSLEAVDDHVLTRASQASVDGLLNDVGAAQETLNALTTAVAATARQVSVDALQTKVDALQTSVAAVQAKLVVMDHKLDTILAALPPHR